MAKKTHKKTTTRKKKNTTSWKSLVAFLVVVLIVGIVKTFADENTSPAPQPQVEGLEKVIIPEGTSNEIVNYEGCTVYFNRDTHIPNCTVYELTVGEAQAAGKRVDNFQQDTSVEGCPTLDDYKYSGYDRGHLVPAGDMKWSSQAMNDCFYLTNMLPQKQALNSGAWNQLEQKVRNWAIRDSALIIVTGPVLSKYDWNTTIGDTRVVVPSSMFKAILAPHTTPMRAIAFVYSNKKAEGSLADHAVSIDHIENITGLDLFSSLPDDIEPQIESTCDFKQWNASRPKNKKKSNK
jgi:endonuclease G